MYIIYDSSQKSELYFLKKIGGIMNNLFGIPDVLVNEYAKFAAGHIKELKSSKRFNLLQSNIEFSQKIILLKSKINSFKREMGGTPERLSYKDSLKLATKAIFWNKKCLEELNKKEV